MYCLAFCFEFYNHHTHKTKRQKQNCIKGKVIIRINFNPGLGLTGFRTILGPVVRKRVKS